MLHSPVWSSFSGILVSTFSWSFKASFRMISCSFCIFARIESPVSVWYALRTTGKFSVVPLQEFLLEEGHFYSVAREVEVSFGRLEGGNEIFGCILLRLEKSGPSQCCSMCGMVSKA